MTNHETVTVSRPSKTKAEIAFEKAKREKEKGIENPQGADNGLQPTAGQPL